MNKRGVWHVVLVVGLAGACAGISWLWMKQRNESATAYEQLAIARAEIDRLHLLLDKKVAPDQAMPAAPASPELTEQKNDAPAPVNDPAPDTPVATPHPPMSEETVGDIARFDLAMDREFDRLDQREAISRDQTEVSTIQKIKNELTALDDLYRRADKATGPEEQIVIRQEMQQTMGRIIGLSRVDRDERLGSLATHIGYNDPQAVAAFVQEVDRIYRETHMDWAKLFNRGPPPAGSMPSPGPDATPSSPASEP